MSDLSFSADTEVALPAGVHPQDMRGPGYGPPAEPAFQGWHPAARTPFPDEPGQSLPVWQRAALDWSARSFPTIGPNPMRIAQRVLGRLQVTVWVPSTASQGVLLAPSKDMVDETYGVVLLPGNSITLPTEASVWASPVSGQTSGGPVYLVEFVNPAVPVPGT